MWAGHVHPGHPYGASPAHSTVSKFLNYSFIVAICMHAMFSNKTNITQD